MILSALKSATADLHARVEAAMPPLAALATEPGYVAALRALHGFHRDWEPAIWSFVELEQRGLHSLERRKLPLLERDLRALDVAPIPVAPASATDSLRGAAGAFGALYVLEGASLGGRVITRHVAPALGPVFERAGAYFRGYGERTGIMWTSFGTALGAYAREHHADEEIIDGATSCFAALEQWLLTPGVLTLEVS